MTARIHEWCDRLDDPEQGLPCPCTAWRLANPAPARRKTAVRPRRAAVERPTAAGGRAGRVGAPDTPHSDSALDAQIDALTATFAATIHRTRGAA